MNTDFIKGSVYFRVAYLDRDLFYPEIETFVFVGKNLSGIVAREEPAFVPPPRAMSSRIQSA